MRLIDADALRKGIREAACEGDVTVRDVLTTIDLFPTIEAEPVRHGRWIHVKKHLWRKDKNGKIDMWQLDCGYHNGPECEVCGIAICEHCHEDWADLECDVGYHVCSECKQRNYDTAKNKSNTPDRLEMNKYCRFCRKHTLHKESK